MARGAIQPRETVALISGPVLMAGLTLLGAAGLWVASLAAIDPQAMTDYGLVSVLPMSFYLAGFFVAVTLALCQYSGLAETAVPVLALVVLVLILHATPAIVYDTMRYPWSWRHIGIIDYLQRNDATAPGDPNLLIYLDWPLFFLVFARAAQLFGTELSTLAAIGRFFPVAINLLYVGLLLGLFRQVSDDARLNVRAVAVFLVGNWIGQDYFSPQAVAFVLYLAILLLALRYLGRRQPGGDWLARFRPVTRLRGLLDDGRAIGTLPDPEMRRLAGLAAGALVICLVASHQLTPILLLLSLTGLVLLGRLGPRLLIFTVVVQAVWLVVFAEATMARLAGELSAGLGHIDAGTFGAMVDTGLVSAGQRAVSVASRGLSGIVALFALAGLARRRRAGFRDGAFLVLAGAPILLVAMTSYGGEIVFRVYLYALPFLAFFAAAAFAPFDSRHPDIGPVGAFLMMAFLLVGWVCFLLANNGKDRQYRIGAEEVAAVDWLYSEAAPGALLIEGNSNYPRQLRHPEKFVHVPLDLEPDIDAALLEDPEGLLGEWLRGWPGEGYILVTRSQEAEDEALQLLPGGGLDALSDRLAASGAFCLLRDEPAARIFTLCDRLPGEAGH